MSWRGDDESHSVSLQGCTALQAPTVLIVEDNPDFVQLWQRYLMMTRCRIVSTPRGEDALALAQQERPTVVLLDINLPQMDGWQVLRALKSHAATHNIPVVICSGNDVATRSLAEGAHAYLRKPVQWEDFRCVMSQVGVGDAPQKRE